MVINMYLVIPTSYMLSKIALSYTICQIKRATETIGCIMASRTPIMGLVMVQLPALLLAVLKQFYKPKLQLFPKSSL